MANSLTPEQLRKMLADNPDIVVEDDGRPMGEAPVIDDSWREIVGDMVNRAREMQRDINRIQARTDRPTPKYKSKTEKRAHKWLEENTDAVEVLYEPIMLRLDSGNYTPDFLCRMRNREIWLVEVKGSWKAYQSGRSSKKSLIEASKQFWFLARFFSLVVIPKKDGGGWKFEEIT